MMLAACSSDDDEFVEENQGDEVYKEVIISVGTPAGDGDTRMNVDGLNISWEQGDQLVLTATYNGKFRTFDFDIIPGSISQRCVKGKTYSTAQFKGNVLMGIRDFGVHYKARTLREADTKFGRDLIIDYHGMVQNGFNNQEHIKDYLDLRYHNKDNNDKIDIVDLIEKNSNLALNTSILKINVKSLPKEMANANQVTWKIVKYINQIRDVKTVGTLKFNGELNEGGDNYLEMPFCPYLFELLKGNDFVLEFSDGKTTGTVQVKATKKVSYLSAHVYKVIVSADNQGPHSLYNWTFN